MTDPLAPESADPSARNTTTKDDLDEVRTSLDELAARMRVAIPSFLGLTVTVVSDSGDVSLTSVSPADGGTVRTSLEFSVVQPHGTSARYTFYAGRPGALSDLDADLAYLTRRSHGHAGAPTDVRLDADLARSRLVEGPTGIGERSTRQRAEGVLIDAGVAPEVVAVELQQRAATAGLDPLTYAKEVLRDAVG